MSKTALLGLIKVLSAELGPEGIRVNGIAPGIIKTKFSKAVSFCLFVFEDKEVWGREEEKS